MEDSRSERERERQVEIRDAFTNCVVSLEVEVYIRMQPCDQRLLNTRVDEQCGYESTIDRYVLHDKIRSERF